MKKDEIWGPKGAETLSDLVVIEDVLQGKVYAYPRFGGCRMSMDVALFQDTHQHFDHEMIDSLAARFRPTHLALDDFDDGQSIPAFTNGESYSCGERPFFEKDVILEHIESGLLKDSTQKVWFDEGLGTFVEIVSHDFKDIPDTLDLVALRDKAEAEGGQYDMDHPELGSLTTITAQKHCFEHEGREVTVYSVFNGWSWFTADHDQGKVESVAPGL